MQGLAGDVAPVGPAEQPHHRGNILRPAFPLERIGALGVRRNVGALRIDQPGRHAVDRDALRPEFGAERSGQTGNTGLRRDDVGTMAAARMRRQAAEHDDRCPVAAAERRQRGLD